MAISSGFVSPFVRCEIMVEFNLSVLDNEPAVRAQILAVLQAALRAVDPYQAVKHCMQRDGFRLQIADRSYDLQQFKRIVVVGAGKAGAPMAQAVEATLADRIDRGLVVVKSGHGGSTEVVKIVEANHPVPDAAGLAAGRQILDLVGAATVDDLVIVLISGGGSALLEAPAGISLDDLQRLTASLLASGATINEINCLRKHMSLIKGGQLARAASPATLVTLVLSDVVGSPLDVIASGPSVPDANTWADAWDVVQRYELERALPPAVLNRLQAGLDGQILDTPKPGDPIFANAHAVVVGDNRSAAHAACRQAQKSGYQALLLTTYLEGEASETAIFAVALGKEVKASGHPLPAPACLVLGGETTVTLGNNPGTGGRNQELALAAAIVLDGIDGITVAALATDGTDGPTDSAGAIVDGGTVGRGRAYGLDAEDFLRRHDAHPFLTATGDLLVSGPTRTNVNDLLLIFVDEA